MVLIQGSGFGGDTNQSDAIRYPGGKALGGEAHHAMVVVNPRKLIRGGRPSPPRNE